MQQLLFVLLVFRPDIAFSFLWGTFRATLSRKAPDSSIFQISCRAYPRVSSLTLSIQLQTVSSFASPSSPAKFLCARLCWFFHFSNQPFEALNSFFPSLSAMVSASSCNIGPLTGMLDALQRWYHSHRILLSSPYCCSERPCFLSRFPPSLDAHFSNKNFFDVITLLIWDFPHENFAARSLLPTDGFLLAYSMTSVFSFSLRNFRLTPRLPSCFMLFRFSFALVGYSVLGPPEFIGNDCSGQSSKPVLLLL